MKKPDGPLLDAVVKLMNEDSFEVFMKWVKESRDLEALLSTNMDKEPQGSWMRGRVQQLSQIVEVVANAREMLAAVQRGE